MKIIYSSHRWQGEVTGKMMKTIARLRAAVEELGGKIQVRYWHDNSNAQTTFRIHTLFHIFSQLRTGKILEARYIIFCLNHVWCFRLYLSRSCSGACKRHHQRICRLQLTRKSSCAGIWFQSRRKIWTGNFFTPSRGIWASHRWECNGIYALCDYQTARQQFQGKKKQSPQNLL